MPDPDNPNSAMGIAQFTDKADTTFSLSRQRLTRNPTHSAFLPAAVYGMKTGVHLVPNAEICV